jgi:quercetin dioxygenase-like cupin family protein
MRLSASRTHRVVPRDASGATSPVTLLSRKRSPYAWPPVTEPRNFDLSAAEALSHDAGVVDREVEVDGTRWALVEYSPRSGRNDWCSTPHAGYVVSGTVTYRFDDERDPLVIRTGEAFVLPAAPRHRGRNEGDEVARLFLIDALPGA